MQGSIRLFWEVFIISLVEFLIKTILRMYLIQLVQPNLRGLLCHLVLSMMVLPVQIHYSYQCHSAFSEDEHWETMVNITFLCVQWMSVQNFIIKKKSPLFSSCTKRGEKMYHNRRKRASSVCISISC